MRVPHTDVERCRGAIACLHAIRSALEVYKTDTNGKFPARLRDLLPKYLNQIPTIDLPGHSKTASIFEVIDVQNKNIEQFVTDTGGWLYFSNPDSKLYGTVVLNCSHKFKSQDLCKT